MGDIKKAGLADRASATAAKLAQAALRTPAAGTTIGLPPGVRVVTNSAQSSRFPLPLTIGSVVLGTIGAIAAARGYRLLGGGLFVVGLAGLGAAAAAPELNNALANAGAPTL